MQITQVTHNSKWYTMYAQEWGMDCGPTCVGMAKYRLKGIGSDMDWMRKYTKKNLVSPGIQGKIAALGKQSRDIGTYPKNIVDLAKSIGLNAKYRYDSLANLVNILATGGNHKVFICHVGWYLGGGHFVFVPCVDKGDVIVLDPYYGMQAVKNLSSYNHSGTFTGHYVEITTH